LGLFRGCGLLRPCLGGAAPLAGVDRSHSLDTRMCSRTPRFADRKKSRSGEPGAAPMKDRQPLGIRHNFWLATALTVSSTVLGAGALHKYQLYRCGQYAERLRVEAMAETYAAQVAPLTLAGKRAEVISFIEQLACHQTTCLVAVLDSEDNPLAVRGNAPFLKQYLELSATGRPSTRTEVFNVSGSPDQYRPEVNLAAAPIFAAGSSERLGTLVHGARLSDASKAAPGEVWRFFFNLMLIAATGMVLGFLWLKQKVLRPLNLLIRRSRDRRGPGPAPSLPTHRADEIGDLARVLADMSANVDQWRRRAVRLERSVTDRVAAETYKITRELRQVRKQSWTDPLTKLGNRRLLEDKFADIFRAQREAGQDLSIVMIDVDHFKTLNDVLGHQAGDELLSFAGELLRQCLRPQDVAVRYGGDEFVLVLPAVSVEEAESIARRTALMFAQQTRLLRVEPKPTMSAGVASLFEHGPATAGDILQQADQALYEAKNAGKCQIRVYQASCRTTAAR